MIPSYKSLILIVDDTPKNLQVLGKTLHEIGYNIAVANSGNQAIDSIEKEKPDLILLDIQMPEMDGFEVCRRLKQNEETKDIPIIFLTAVTESSKIIEGFELGAVDYITKPFNSSELSVRVATHLEIKQSRERLHELNATKDKFFKIIAHDLRNPFTGIIGLSENIERILTTTQTVGIDKILKYTQIIHSSAISAESLLENLLEWAKSQSGRLDIHPKIISIDQIFNKNIELMKGMALKKEIEIEKQETVDEAFADELLVNTIIRNLLSNALKFTEKGGKVYLSSKQKGDWIEISIQDTGIGIDPKNIGKIFRIDSKFTNLGTDKEKGTGLGLLLCKEFVEKQGGNIWVSSVLGEGTTFSFTVPAKTKE